MRTGHREPPLQEGRAGGTRRSEGARHEDATNPALVLNGDEEIEQTRMLAAKRPLLFLDAREGAKVVGKAMLGNAVIVFERGDARLEMNGVPPIAGKPKRHADS